MNPGLCRWLLDTVSDQRAQVEFICDVAPVATARNQAVAIARKAGVDWLVMSDNDNVPPAEFIDRLLAAPDDIAVLACNSINAPPYICETCPTVLPRNEIGEYAEVAQVGGGVLAIRKQVWETIPEPLFAMSRTRDGEECCSGEDAYFGGLARGHGFKLWVPKGMMAAHLRTLDLADYAHINTELAKLRYGTFTAK